jgi:predicted TIM-barrel fold metal-dependent hydrolase
MSESSAEIRKRLSHPVIDIDGHMAEYFPALAPYLEAEGLSLDHPSLMRMLPPYGGSQRTWHEQTPEQRAATRTPRGPWWSSPARQTIDLASALFPGLLHERLDELGLDFSVVYPSLGLVFLHTPDDTYRRGTCRALNRCNAETFAPYADRLAPVAAIPMHTPEEAVDELEYAVNVLGFKAVLCAGYVQRPFEALAHVDPEVSNYAFWLDQFGLDSLYDYDPVWAKCTELGIAPTFHSTGSNQALRNSPTNFTYNHIGHFADAGHAAAKGIFLGGVTRRFPELRFAFLEGGVGWASQLFGDLIEHWERRNLKALENMKPEKLDRSLLMSYVEKYGYAEHAAALRERDGWPDPELHMTGNIDNLDDFAACKITRKEDWVDLYAKPYYFGCEADDRMNAVAFGKGNPFGAQLNAIYSSDIGHFDVIDMRDPLPEAYELVEDGHITERNFRDFVFENAVRLWGTQNPRFFEGTVVEKEAASVLRAAQPAVVHAAAAQ